MKIETQATGSTPAHEAARRASEVVGEAPRDLTVDGLRKLVDKLERAHQTQAAIAWQHYQRAQAAEARLAPLQRVAEAAYHNLLDTYQVDLVGRPVPFNLDGLDPTEMPAVERWVYEALLALRDAKP